MMATPTAFGAANLLMLFLLGGSAGLPVGLPPAEPDPLMAKIAPEEALYYSTWAGMAAPDAASKNQTEQLLAEAEVQLFIREIDKQLTGALRQAAEREGNPQARLAADVGPTLLKTLLTHPAAIFVSKFEPKPRGADVEAGLVVNCGDKVADVRALIERLQKETIGDKAEEIELADNKFYRIKVDDEAPLVTWGTRASYLVVGIGEGAVEGMFERAKTEPPKWLSEGLRQLPVDRVATFSYVDVNAIIEKAVPLAGGPKAAAAIEAVGAGNVGSLISVTGLDETGFVNRSLLTIEGEAQGIFKLADGEPLSRENLSAVPQDAAIAAAWRLDSEKLLDTALQVIGEIEPRAAEETATGLERLETMLGINLRGDLLKALGDTWCIYSDPAAGGMITGWTATVDIRDRDKLSATHDKLVALARGAFGLEERSPQIKQMSFAGKEIYYLVVPDDDMPLSPAWCLTERHLVVGLYPQTIKAFLSRGDDFQLIAKNDEVAQLFEAQGSGPLSVTYVDTKQIFDPAYAVMQVFAQAAIGQIRREGIEIDISTLPSAGAIRKHLRPTVSATRRTEAGIEVIGRQTLPGGSIGASAPVVAGLLLPAVQAARAAARRASGMNNLKQIAIAMHNHHDVYRALPAAYSVDKDGKPLLSWRVHILPYIEEGALYERFHLDEPWDSEHNRALIPLMPQIYKAPGSFAEPGKTNYLGIRGENTLLAPPADSEKGKERPVGISFAKVTDGTSNTAMVVEASDKVAVVWTKPDDFVPTMADPAKGLTGIRPGGFLTVFGDAHVRLLPERIDAQTLRNLFSRDDGNAVQLD